MYEAGSGNLETHWIPGQARNDTLSETYVVMYTLRSKGAIPGDKDLVKILLVEDNPNDVELALYNAAAVVQ